MRKYMNEKFRKHYRIPFLFLLMATVFLCTLPDELHGWNSGWYAMDYSLGLDSRLFIGSLLRLFYPDFLPASAVYAFTVLSILVLLALLSYVLGYALERAEGMSGQTGLTVLTALYLLSPGSPAYLWSTENMGRFDLYLLLVTLAAGIVCLRLRSVPVCLIVLTICGLIGLSIHQGYLFTFFPLLFTLFLTTLAYTGTADRQPRKIRLYSISAFLCMGLLGAVFFYFQFLSHIHVDTCGELVGILSSRTDLALNESAFRYEYFSGITQSIQELVFNELGERIRYGVITLLLLSPLAVLYGWFWKQIWKSCSDSGIRKASENKEKGAGCPSPLFYLCILLSQLMFLPAFALTIDWGRWFGAFLTVQTLQIVFLAAKKDAVVLSALETLSAAVHRPPLLFLFMAVWLGNLRKFQATLLPDAPVFFASLYKLLHLFQLFIP